MPPRRTYSRQEQETRYRACCIAWLTEIAYASQILRTGGSSNKNVDPKAFTAMDESIQFLHVLEGTLNKLEVYWNQPPLQMPPKFRPSDAADDGYPRSSENQKPLVMRRLQVRVVTAQSELYAHKASRYRYTRPLPQWTLGAETYDMSLNRIHLALELADSEYARLMLEEDSQVDSNGMSEDANIVAISVQYLTGENRKFRKAADQQAERLRRKLEPQWTSRDEVRSKMGEERWNSNPRPKYDYAALRKADEAELRDIEAAILQLDAMAVPDDVADRYTKQKPTSNQQQRYNATRPNNLSRRVSLRDYPDPTFYGWKFTGSWNNYVEFFEIQQLNDVLVKLDWYFTTATVKTSMHHPTQGKTQMFGSVVTPEVFCRILADPRAHTNVRYQIKDKKPEARFRRGAY